MKVGLTKAGSSTRSSTRSSSSVELIRGCIVVPYAKALGVRTVQQRRVLEGGSDAGSSSWSWKCDGGIGMSLGLDGRDALALDERLGLVWVLDVRRWRRCVCHSSHTTYSSASRSILRRKFFSSKYSTSFYFKFEFCKMPFIEQY